MRYARGAQAILLIVVLSVLAACAAPVQTAAPGQTTVLQSTAAPQATTAAQPVATVATTSSAATTASDPSRFPVDYIKHNKGVIPGNTN